ncbi:MAG: pitrilysin family protein [Planctomycetia bacterium]|jgi:predicted Zn-dependent peptidase|nr:pitrilysin family protein [Planctomycetia bacterium]
MVTFKHKQLKNGLDIVAELNSEAQSVAIGFMVKTGARDESSEVYGVSHFLEHMMFKGTSRRSSADVNREFDAMGARNNAFTSNEVTCYWAHILPEFLPAALDLLSDMMRPALRGEDFDMEKKVILEEIALYLDRPGHVLYEAIMQDHFRRHPLAHSVLGTRESITALTRDQMQTYFDARYGPGNMVLAVAGKIDFDELWRLAEQTCGQWKHLDVRRQYPAADITGGVRHICDPRLKRHYVAMICPGPSAQHEGRYAAQVLSDVIGDHDGSRFYWALVEPGLADEADYSFYPHDGAGSFFAYASCDPARSQQVTEILSGELQKIVLHGLTDQEISRSKNKIATAAVLQGELPLGRMRNICSRWIYNQEYKTLEEDLQLLEAVNGAAIRKVIQEFPFNPVTTTTLGPAA